MRWRQTTDPDTGKSVFVPADAAARRAQAAIHGPLEPFRSPIDGSVISDRKQLREHCQRHNVVPAQEFSQEFYDRKAREREKVYKAGVRTKSESMERKREIYEIMNHLERQNGR